MVRPLRLLSLGLLAATALAQGGKSRGEARPGPERDDPLTRKDPAIVLIDKFIQKQRVSRKRADWRRSLPPPPPVEFQPDRDYLWHLHTSKGAITIRFMPAHAPIHVANAIYLTRREFYDGLGFHRVIEGFMAQGGCPIGDGTGGPGYTIDGEFDPAVKHDKPGILSTANEGRPRTDGSQFFLTFAPAPHLDGKHTVFGEVTEGAEVLKQIEACAGPAATGKPTEPLTIVRAWVTVAERPATKDHGDGGDGGDGGGGEKKPGDKKHGDRRAANPRTPE